MNRAAAMVDDQDEQHGQGPVDVVLDRRAQRQHRRRRRDSARDGRRGYQRAQCGDDDVVAAPVGAQRVLAEPAQQHAQQDARQEPAASRDAGDHPVVQGEVPVHRLPPVVPRREFAGRYVMCRHLATCCSITGCATRRERRVVDRVITGGFAHLATCAQVFRARTARVRPTHTSIAANSPCPQACRRPPRLDERRGHPRRPVRRASPSPLGYPAPTWPGYVVGDAQFSPNEPCRPAPDENRAAPSRLSVNTPIPCRSSPRIAVRSFTPSWSRTEARSPRRQACGKSAMAAASSSAAARARPGRHDAVGEAHPVRLGGGHRAAGQDHVHRAAGADEPGEPNRAAVDERHAPAAAEDPEDRVLLGDPQIAPERQLQTTRPPRAPRPPRSPAWTAACRVGPIGPSPSSRDPVAALRADAP